MGQTIDLPDPLEKAAPLPAPSADELLAQLAGDEIDRLLAEADARPDPLPPIAPPAPTPAPAPANKLVDPATDPKLALELDSLFNQLQSESHSPIAPAAPVAATAIPTEDSQLRKELDALYNPLAPETPAAAPGASPSREPQNAEFSAALASLDVAADPSAQTDALERQVLASEDLMKAAIEAAMPAHADAPMEAEAAADAAPAEAAVRRSLNPLAWISARFSDATLDALGKVAILTLINALAILLYVVIFRRH